jgi:hypothetical protein
MNGQITANAINGRATGALFFTGFGTLWLVLALYAREQITASRLALLAGGTLVLAACAVWVMQKAKGLPVAAEDPAINRAFGRINLAQWIAVAVVAFVFARLHIDAYILSAITAIVGLHMLPLARLFRYKPHYLTAAVLVAWATASVFLFPAERLQGATALGTGAILWASAFVTLLLAVGQLRPQLEAAEN